MAPNPHPSPLLAGIGADEWRKRLANFKAGDPLPDPRTPTGDKAIDAIAHAAGQQNSTYAWGGNQNVNGPSRGQDDNGDGAHQNHDFDRIGYDCGGLVRYSLEQATGHDGFVRSDQAQLQQQHRGMGAGTDRLDKSALLQPVENGGRLLTGTTHADVLPRIAQPGDVLVFEKPGAGHQEFDGRNTQHTGIYIGNGFMMNAPESGEPVKVDDASRDGRRVDVLRIKP